MNPAAPQRRSVTRVAVGVLIRGDGRVLMADRPVGKPYAGYWEFPGGKIEPGEGVDAALKRELREELGIDIGGSVPWVTFEFDYPHAYVELQFRFVRCWRGEPHAREGQRLRFVDPSGELPQPLLPAASPALRWLLLPPVALVIGPQCLPAALAGERVSGRGIRNDSAGMMVVEADWRTAGQRSALAALRGDPATRRFLLLASGPGAHRITDADGVVLEASARAQAAREQKGGWRGAWASCADELQAASEGGFDFILVRSAALAERLKARPASMPAYFLSGTSCDPEYPGDWPGHGCWIDLRPPTESGD